MTVRTTSKSVTFRRPFSLKGADGLLSAETYVVETVEEAIPALSFLAYRRLSTMILSTRYGGGCRTAGGHDRSSGPRSGSGTRPRLNKPDELTASSPRQAGLRFCIGSIQAGTIDHCR
jgi:hypothetical protein